MESDVRSFEGYELLEHIVLAHEEMTAVNSAQTQAVLPKSVTGWDGLESGRLPKASWNVIRLKKKG